MKKIVIFFIIHIVFILGCNSGCKDENACNDGMDEPCKYSDEQEAILEGEWSLIDMKDVDGDYLFSSSEDTDYELDSEIEFIHLKFYDDNTCEIETGPSDISANIYTSDWSINACYERLNFQSLTAVETETNTMNPDEWPFGYLVISYLSDDLFICEDLNSNTLRWQRE